MVLNILIFLMISYTFSSLRIAPLRPIRNKLRMSESFSTVKSVPSINRNTIIVLSGATSVGKSAVSMELCKRLNAEIVVADSVQVYKHLNIGANKASPEEMAAVPHHLVDLHDTSMVLNAGEFAVMAAEKIVDIQKRGKVPVVVGGSLMWVNWLVSGQPDAPLPSEKIVQRAQELLQEAESVQNWFKGLEVLEQYDPKRAKSLNYNDWYRLRRYLEVALSLKEKNGSNSNSNSRSSSPIDGQSPAATSEETEEQPVLTGQRRSFFKDADIRHIFITEHKDSLYRTIDERCEQMLSAGLLQEVAELLLLGVLTPDLVVTRAIGYRQTIDYLLRKDYTPNDVDAFNIYLKAFCAATRGYARQQISYHRKGDTALFVRMDRSLNTNRSPFHRSDKKDPKVRRPPPMLPLADAVDRLADEVLHWCSIPAEEFQQQVKTQMKQGKTYGTLMKQKSLPKYYSIENSPDGEPQFVRYMLARMVRSKLLKVPPPSVEPVEGEISWIDSLLDPTKGVTPDTVQDIKSQWTGQEIDIRSQETNVELMRTYQSRVAKPDAISPLVKMADELREMLMARCPETVEKFQKEFNAPVSTVSRRVAAEEEEEK